MTNRLWFDIRGKVWHIRQDSYAVTRAGTFARNYPLPRMMATMPYIMAKVLTDGCSPVRAWWNCLPTMTSGGRMGVVAYNTHPVVATSSSHCWSLTLMGYRLPYTAWSESSKLHMMNLAIEEESFDGTLCGRLRLVMSASRGLTKRIAAQNPLTQGSYWRRFHWSNYLCKSFGRLSSQSLIFWILSLALPQEDFFVPDPLITSIGQNDSSVCFSGSNASIGRKKANQYFFPLASRKPDSSISVFVFDKAPLALP